MPDTHDKRLNLALPQSLLARIDDWRRTQKTIPTRSEAARKLIEESLDRHPATKAKPPA